MIKREKLVYSYMVALSRLYGFLEWKQFIKVFNKYNVPKITKTEINKTPYYWNKRGGYCKLYIDALVYSKVDDDMINEARYYAEGKEYYMPTEEEIRALSKPKEYMQQSAEHTLLYNSLWDILSKNKRKTDNIEERYKILCVELGMMISSGADQNDIFRYLNYSGLNVFDMEEAQSFINILTNAWNNTRVWANRGYTPNEMIAKMPKETEPVEPILVPNMTGIMHDTNNPFAVGFYKLWYKLIYWINEKYKIVPSFPVPIYGELVDEQPFVKIRESLWENPHYIDEFLTSADASTLKDEDRISMSDWRKKFMKGMFLIHKHLDEYSVFQLMEQDVDNDKLYGVCGITNKISDIFSEKPTPFLVNAVLLPFKGKIVYDTFLAPYNISFMDKVKESFAQYYKESYDKNGIITTL